MRKALLTLLLLPLWSAPGVDPGQFRAVPDRRLPGFPLRAENAPLNAASSSLMFVPLDVSGESFRLTAADAGVAFDVDGDGARERVPWPEAPGRVALLAIDTDGDGRISSGREVLGSHATPSARNGATALVEMFKISGAPQSGTIREGHELYDRLLLWTDRNRNGISEPGELSPAKSRFTAIGLGFTKVGWQDEHGNRVRFRGWAELRTAGPEQQHAIDRNDQQRRQCHFYDVVLQSRDNLPR